MKLRACLIALLCAARALGDVVPVDHYRIGNTLHVILRNQGDAAAEVSPKALVRADGFSLPLWWSAAYPRTLAPGALGRVSLGLRREDTLAGPFSLRLALGEVPLALSGAEEDGLRVLRYVQFPGTGTAVVCAENLGGDACEIDAVGVGESPNLLDPAHSDPEILPCETGVLTLRTPAAANDAAPILFALHGDGGWHYRHAYAFAAPGFRAQIGEVQEGYLCPTHRHGPWSRAASEMLLLEPQVPVQFCRNQAPEGMAALAQIAPRAVVNPQGSNLSRGTPEAWQGLRAFATAAVRAAAPGQLEALLEPNSNFDGLYPQPTESQTETMTPRDLEYTALAALAAGCGGLRLRLGDHPAPEYAELARSLVANLTAHAPRMSVAIPLSLRAQVTNPEVLAVPIYTSPADLLLIVLRKSPADSAESLEITLDPPPWFTPHALHGLAGPLPTGVLPASGRIRLHFDAFRDLAAVFLSTD